MIMFRQLGCGRDIRKIADAVQLVSLITEGICPKHIDKLAA